MTSAIEKSNQIQKLQALIQDIEYGMLTTLDSGYLRSRPMASMEQAEYWDAPAGWVAKTIGFVQAVTTGERAKTSENAKINL